VAWATIGRGGGAFRSVSRFAGFCASDVEVELRDRMSSRIFRHLDMCRLSLDRRPRRWRNP
jgi:hypothetical protein